MCTVDEFRSAFADAHHELTTFSAAVVGPLHFPAPDAAWLTGVGLPQSAAPFLGFASNYEIGMPLLGQLWGVPDAMGGSRYRVIGSNGSGDPIVIDMTDRSTVAYLNHDANFAVVYINKSVVALAACLLGYKEFAAECLAANGPDAFVDRRAPSAALERFCALVQSVDLAAVAPDTMWGFEIQQFGGTPAAG